jgi:type II secretory pathway pseudopilin PulG
MNKRIHRGSTRSSFTILELLVVISIIAILIGIAIPSYFSIQQKARIARTKDEVRYISAAYRNYLMDKKTWPSCVNDGNPHDIKDDYYSMLTGGEGTVYFEFRNYETNYSTKTKKWTYNNDGALDLFSQPDKPATWQAYQVIFDHDYDNQITYNGTIIAAPVGVIALISNRADGYDVASWE